VVQLISSHHITSHHTTSHHITSHHIKPHHTTSHHITPHHTTSHHTTSHHMITPHHITSHHITSHHITSPLTVQIDHTRYRWHQQGFNFNTEKKNISFGLVQRYGGPCGVLAPGRPMQLFTQQQKERLRRSIQLLKQQQQRERERERERESATQRCGSEK